MGLAGFEPATSPLSGVRSNQLSYKPGVGRRAYSGQRGSVKWAVGTVRHAGQAVQTLQPAQAGRSARVISRSCETAGGRMHR